MIKVRVSPSERKTIEAHAAQAGLPVSTFMREVATGSRPRSILDNQAMGLLIQTSANLNKVVRWPNLVSARLNIPQEIETLIKLLQAAMRRRPR